MEAVGYFAEAADCFESAEVIEAGGGYHSEVASVEASKKAGVQVSNWSLAEPVEAVEATEAAEDLETASWGKESAGLPVKPMALFTTTLGKGTEAAVWLLSPGVVFLLLLLPSPRSTVSAVFPAGKVRCFDSEVEEEQGR